MVNAQRVFLKENSHFHQDRPHGPVFLFENPPIMHFQIRKRWYKNFPRDLVGAPGRGTWSQHIRPAWVPPAPAGCPPVYPPHKPGTHHTHSLTQSYIHTERHHKNPKDKSFGKKYLILQSLKIKLNDSFDIFSDGGIWFSCSFNFGDHICVENYKFVLLFSHFNSFRR